MVTVDDLVISLTIKETGRLGRLQKQLDSLVGKKGRISGITNLTGGMMYIKRDLKTIIARLKYLMPTEIPRGSKGQVIAAKTTSDLMDKYSRKYAKSLVPQKESDQKRMMEEFGVENIPELEDALESKISDWQYRLEAIMSSEYTGPKAQRLIARFDDMIKRADMDVGRRKELLTSIEAAISEFNVEVAQLLEKVGIKAFPEMFIYRPIKKLIPEAIRQAISRGDYFNLSTIAEKAGITTEEGLEAVKTIEGLASVSESTMDFFESAIKMLKIDLEPKMFTKKAIEKDESEKLKAILAGMFFTYFKTGGKGGIPEKDFRDLFNKLVKNLLGSELKWERVRIDMAILQGDFDTLKDIFGEKMAKAISQQSIYFQEFKKDLTKDDVDQFENYQDYVGDRIAGVSSTIKASFKQLLPNILTKTMNIMQQLAKVGAVSKLTEAQKEKIMEEAMKGLEPEKFVDALDTLLKSMLPGVLSKKDIEKISDSIQSFKDALNVNPNWVDLPGWTQDTGEQIRKIREQTDKIGTDESKKLFDMFLKLRDDLAPKDIMRTPENVKSLVDQLLVVYKGMEEQEEYTEEEKGVLKYSMMKAIVDMKIGEWKALREEYTKYPSMIMEGLKEIKDKTQEFQEVKESQWKKTLLGKMDGLIKNVSEYRSELIKTIGRRDTTPKKDTLPPGFEN